MEHQATVKNVNKEKTALLAFYGGIVLGLAALFYLIAASMLSYYSFNKTAEFDRALLAPLEARKNTGDVTAVLVGNSRLRHAVTFGFEPEKPFILPDGRRLWSVQYAQDVAMFEAYEEIWPAILAARPDVIVLQDVLLTTDRLVEAASVAGFSNLVYNQMEKRFSGVTPRQQWRRDRFEIIDTCIEPEDYNHAEMQDRLIFAAYRDRHALDEGNENTVKARAAIKQALDAGIKIVILHLPANESVIARFGVPLHLVDFYGLGFSPSFQQLAGELEKQPAYLSYPVPPPSDFCDFVHLNGEGRAAFTAWLIEKIL